jgi:ElaB/YqjD/DUF883 family membrane-anchored ribosome-binding protein
MIKLFLGLTLSISLWASETLKGVSKDFATVKEELSQQLAKVQADIKTLRDKTQDQMLEKGNEARALSFEARQKTLVQLEKTQSRLQKQVDELSDDGQQKWKSLKSKMAKSLENLNKKVQKALAE